MSKVSGYLLVNFLIMKYWFLETGHQEAQNCCPHNGGNEQVTPMIAAWRECAGHRAGQGVQADPGKFHECMSQTSQSGVEPKNSQGRVLE